MENDNKPINIITLIIVAFLVGICLYLVTEVGALNRKLDSVDTKITRIYVSKSITDSE